MKRPATTSAPSAADFERLESRLAKLAEQKAYYQLIMRLMERLNPLPGLEDMVRGMLFSIVECLGGTNIKLYYWVGEELRYRDFHGESGQLATIDDATVAEVAMSRVMSERRGCADEALLKDGLLRNSWTWTFPLLVGEELIGVIKLENLHVHGASLGRYLPLFVNHAALILSNEIRNYRRQSAESARAESEARLRLLIERMPIALAYVTHDGLLQLHNEHLVQLFGYTPEEVRTLEDWWCRAYPDEAYRREVVDAWSAAVRAAVETGTNIRPTEYRVTCKNGDVRVVEVSGVPLGDGLLATFIDLTDRKRAEEHITRLNRELEARVSARTAQLEAANRELEAFSFSVSHDLRAPLRAIDGFSRILLDEHGAKLDAEGRRLLNIVRDSTVRMGQLIDAILRLSRLGRSELDVVALDVGSLAQTVMQESRAAANGREIRFVVGELPAAWGDREMIRQVIENLVLNAVKFTKPRAQAVIEIGGKADAGESSYYVKDNGVGFDMAYVDKLFGAFQRLHRTEQFEGTGIGLALVKRIITRHGGRVWAEGACDEGATFHFTLPRTGDALVVPQT